MIERKPLTPRQAADFLGLKTETLAVWRCRKLYPLPFTRAGRMIRYFEDDLVAFLKSRRSER